MTRFHAFVALYLAVATCVAGCTTVPKLSAPKLACMTAAPPRTLTGDLRQDVAAIAAAGLQTLLAGCG